jgi:Rrf2 family protein
MTRSSRFATAVHILALLAVQQDEPVTSDYVASSVNTNAVVIRRLLRKLADAGLVSSCPGGAGGSRLSRDPRQITLYDAYSAVESGSLFGEHSQRPNQKCPVGKNIIGVLEPRVEAADAAAAATLKKTTIADLVSEMHSRN